MPKLPPPQPEFMALAIRLAQRGIEKVSPNPPVGAVIVLRGQILGQGWHKKVGGPHAEVEAIRSAIRAGHQNKLKKADIYVSLEPCGHQGRTPPCSAAIIQESFRRVIYSVPDPNPETRGKGPRAMRKKGIEVISNFLRTEGEELLAPYLFFHREGRPWVLSKWAMSLDGKISTRTGDSKWISNERSRKFVQSLRRRVDAILVGTETYAKDDPLLLPRPPRGRFPLRVILDRQGRLSRKLQIFSDARGPRIYVTAKEASAARVRWMEQQGLEVWKLSAKEQRFNLGPLLKRLGKRGITQILVEGGAEIHGALLDRGLVNEVAAFIAPKIIGGEAAPSPVGGNGVLKMAQVHSLKSLNIKRFGEDVLVHGRL